MVIPSSLELTQDSARHYRRELSSDADLVAIALIEARRWVEARRWPFKLEIHNLMTALSAEAGRGKVRIGRIYATADTLFLMFGAIPWLFAANATGRARL